MKHNKRKHINDNERLLDDDQLRDNTMNETIREVSGSPDTDLNNLSEGTERGLESDRYSDTSLDRTQGSGYTPNDSSGVRSGGITDMDDQTSGGAGLNTGVRQGAGSHLRTKDSITGSDYDGQNATS
jgi:hypothetical protein